MGAVAVNAPFGIPCGGRKNLECVLDDVPGAAGDVTWIHHHDLDPACDVAPGQSGLGLFGVDGGLCDRDCGCGGLFVPLHGGFDERQLRRGGQRLFDTSVDLAGKGRSVRIPIRSNGPDVDSRGRRPQRDWNAGV